MMAFLVSSSILIVLSLGLPSMVSRDRMGRHPPKGRVGGEFLLARQTLLWCPRNGSNFREIRIPQARFPRRTLLGSSLNKRAATIHPGTIQLCGGVQTSFIEYFYSRFWPSPSLSTRGFRVPRASP